MGFYLNKVAHYVICFSVIKMSVQQNDALLEEINRISKKYGISVENVTSQEFQKDIELLANNIQQNQKVRINRKTAVHYVPPTCIQMQETPEEDISWHFYSVHLSEVFLETR